MWHSPLCLDDEGCQGRQCDKTNQCIKELMMRKCASCPKVTRTGPAVNSYIFNNAQVTRGSWKQEIFLTIDLLVIHSGRCTYRAVPPVDNQCLLIRTNSTPLYYYLANTSNLASFLTSSSFRLYISSMNADRKVFGPFTSALTPAFSPATV
jgi:hypothetical protein